MRTFGAPPAELFVHRSDVLTDDRRLRVGERLEYNIRRNRLDGKLKASEVRRAARLGPADYDDIIDRLFGEPGGFAV